MFTIRSRADVVRRLLHIRDPPARTARAIDPTAASFIVNVASTRVVACYPLFLRGPLASTYALEHGVAVPRGGVLACGGGGRRFGLPWRGAEHDRRCCARGDDGLARAPDRRVARCLQPGADIEVQDAGGDEVRFAPGDAPAEVTPDASPSDACSSDACTECGAPRPTWCAGDASLDCPPAMGSPGYDAWLLEYTSSRPFGPGVGTPRYGGCSQHPCCPQVVSIGFGIGRDCYQYFMFDVATGELVGGLASCNSPSCSEYAFKSCLPEQCFPRPGAWGDPSTLCPPFPDAGSDARAD